MWHPAIQPKPIVRFDIDVAARQYQVDILKEAYHIHAYAISLADTEKFTAGILDMQKTALLLFAGYIDAATTMAESHGGDGNTLIGLGLHQRRIRVRIGATLCPHGNGDEPSAKTRLATISGLPDCRSSGY